MSTLLTPVSPAHDSYRSVADYIFAVQRAQGHFKWMVAGDSIGQGVNYNQGVRVALAAGMLAEGVTPYFVGDNTGNANDRVLYDNYGDIRLSQTKGGFTMENLINGNSATGGADLVRPLATALADPLIAPDGIVLCIGSNGCTDDSIRRFLGICNAYNPSMPVIVITCCASVNLTLPYYVLDTTRSAVTEVIRKAIAQGNGPNVIHVNGDQAIGQFTRYQLNPAPSTITGSNAGTDTFQFVGGDPGYFTGQECQLGTASTDIPALTTRWLIRTAVNTYALATSRANAIAGTKINLTDVSTDAKLLRANDMISNTVCANGIFEDGTHLRMEGFAILYAAAHAQMFGRTATESIWRMEQQSVYKRNVQMAGSAVSAATWTPPAQSLARIKKLKNLHVLNTGVGTAVVTLNKIRYSPDYSVSYTITQKQFSVLTLKDRIFEWGDAGPDAWYNEVWSVDAATSACDITMLIEQRIVA